MQLGFSRREFAGKCGFSAATLQAWEDGRYSVPQKSIVKYVKTVLDCGLITTTEWFLLGLGLPPRPVSGLPDVFAAENSVILKEINFFETQNKNTLITTINDDAMLPYFDMGDYVGGKILSLQYAEKYFGSACIIVLYSGETIVRKLRPGTHGRGGFNLLSTNLETKAPYSFLLDCSIQQFAPVIWHRKIERPLL
ncbi:conserved protein of unknown function [Legionella fallonii LLAP-10]|uniref:HTH cro/C1-type domain-containing protein n=2 Tax=Legionella fallonii TaxID=96230 RepID=A0A098G7R4_9GAMM|nr:conserved protein of unknown function [Legionella fallonii LLAP-10]